MNFAIQARSISFVIRLVAIALPRSGHADSGKEIATLGKGDEVPACLSCHSPALTSAPGSEIPSLAGISKKYLTQQLLDYAGGKRINLVMGPIAKRLSQAEIEAVSTYLGELPADQRSPLPQRHSPSLGEAIATKGQWSGGIPACISCHGDRAQGMGDLFPPLAGLGSGYLKNQLKSWKVGSRPPGPLGIMPAIAKRLSNAEVVAVAAYLAGEPEGKAIRPRAALVAKKKVIAPAEESELGDDAFSRSVLRGRDLFTRTTELLPKNAKAKLNCVNCHLNAGRQAYTAPLWAAFGMYPAYREKTKSVQTLEGRIADCFRYSLNGTAPPRGGEAMTALVSYAAWLSRGVPVDKAMPGRGYGKLKAARKGSNPLPVDHGKGLYEAKCALCHGADGGGLMDGARVQFPPLWGDESFNKAAGMARSEVFAAFIKRNMPLGLGGTLDDADARAIAAYVSSKPRPADPRAPQDK